MSEIIYEFYTTDALSVIEAQIDKTKPVFFDTETIGLYGKIRIAAFYQEHWDKALLQECPEMYSLYGLLSGLHLVCHNASYDISTIQEQLDKNHFYPAKLDDTLLLSRLKYYNKHSFDLDNCIFYATGETPYEAYDKKAMQKVGWDNLVLTDMQKEYSAIDVIYLCKLYNEVKEYANSKSYQLDMLTLKSNLRFQLNGLFVNQEKLIDKYKANQKEIQLIALPINANSYKQVREYINSAMSDDTGLATLAATGNERAANVRRTRKLLKENTFLSKFDTIDGHIYGKFAPTTRSGRSKCVDQNLQQLPRSTKDCFSAEPHHVMVYSDFSQLELRCICAITGDPIMEKLYRQDVDIHSYVAIQLFGTDEPTQEQRRIAKTCNFGLLYGAGVNVFRNILVTSTGILMSEERAKAICARWKNLFPKVKEWQQQGIRDFQKSVAYETPLGRKYVAKLMTDQLNIQVQGMGAEVAKLANHHMEEKFEAIKNEPELSEKGFSSWKRWQRNFIHDSYIFIIEEDTDINMVCKEIADSMQQAWKEISSACKIKDLPMPVKVDVGYNWGDIDEGKGIIHTHQQ